MIIVDPLLTVIFIILYCATKTNYVQRSVDTLHSAMMEDHPASMREQTGYIEGQSTLLSEQSESNRQDTPNGQAALNRQNPPARQQPSTGQCSPTRPRRQELFLMVVDKGQGNYSAVENRPLSTESREAGALVSLAKSMGGESSTLKDQHLCYLRGETMPNQIVRYALADIYEGQNSPHWQLIHSSIIGTRSFAVLFLSSILLSRWAVKPVEDAQQRQHWFVADTSHESKTLLTAIFSNADILKEDRDISEGKSRQRIGHIKAESLWMKQSTESLLTPVRSNSGQETAVCTPIDLGFIVSSSLIAFEPLVFDVDKHIIYDIEVSLHVNGDEKELRQLSDILFDNACKYSLDKGSIRVTLKKSDTKEVLLAVSNEGTLLTEEEIRHLLPRFYRADTARSNIPGYGFGLSITQSIVSGHGRKIDVSADGSRMSSSMVRLSLQK